MLGDLREVLDNGGLEIHLQPKLDLASSTVVGAEALARWQHPTRGWVPPDEFIRVAEETGLIRRLTDQVVTMSVGLARSWIDAGHDLTVSVNLSTLDLLDELLPERIAERLDQHGVAADRLILEITESSLMADTPRTMSTVDRLHRLGVGLSLDDFGTGYSSLSYLRRLPVTELKIDRSFVANVALDAQDEVIVRSTIELGHNLGLRVVAEGAENAPILDRLRALGCDLGQGYGIARPLPPALFDRWLATTPFDVRPVAYPVLLRSIGA
jgi:EAL domain-containing protein (putative c-di-GMP-specific phosphodiesterase class I)